MIRVETYTDLDGERISLTGLDADERRLVKGLRRRAKQKPDWNNFDNFAFRLVGEFYDARGVPRKVSVHSVPFRIAQDLSSRLGIDQGMIRPDDYRDELQELIDNRFSTRSAFCRATGIAPDMLSHVLAGRKDLSLETLSKALGRIGYRLRIVPATRAKRTG